MILSFASSYFAFVPSTTSRGSVTPSLFFWPVETSQSRRYCLSNDAWGLPGEYSAADQYRDESGVRSSSMRMSCLPFGVGSRPNSNFVSARIRPRSRAYAAASA